jgi:hypothetical protein
MLLGVGLAPALPTPATASPARSGHHATTSLRGFSTARASVLLGGTVVDRVQVRPRAHRIVRVQARKPGGRTFVTVSSGFTSRHGDFRAVYQPTRAGTWHFRLLLPAAHRASRLISASRTVTATTDKTAPGPVTALTAVQTATGSDLSLSWTNPSDGDFAGVMIRRAVGPAAPASPTDGALVTRTDPAATSFTDQGLAGDTQYSYALFAFDTAQNSAPGTTATATSGAATTAALTIGGSGAANVKQTLNQAEAFDITGTRAGKGLTLVSGTLDYGDGSATETFSGDPATWVPAGHQYAALGTVTATWTVVDSATKSVTRSVTIKVFDQPTASVSVVSTVLEKNKPITFAVTSATPAGTTFTDFDSFSGAGDNFASGTGPLPPTFQITFAAPGTYTVTVEGFNDADGLAAATVDVVIVDAPAP